MEDQQHYEATNTAIKHHIVTIKEQLEILYKVSTPQSQKLIELIEQLLKHITPNKRAHPGSTHKITREEVSCHYPCSPSDWTRMCRHRGCNPN